jgi:Flp pilus assembly protein TadG
VRIIIQIQEDLHTATEIQKAAVAGGADEVRPGEVCSAAIEEVEGKGAASGVVAMRELDHVHDERGMALFIMVALLIPLGLLMALFMDMGRLYVMRGRMQVAADAAALAGASGFIDGSVGGDSVEARVIYYVAANPIDTVAAVLESLTMNTDSGTLSLVLSHHASSLLLAPEGITIRIGAKAKATLVQPGEIGRPVPNGNAFGWWKKNKTVSAGKDSAMVRLGS